MTIAAIIDNRTTPLFIAAIRVLIEQRGCISAAFLSRERDFRNGSKAPFWPSADHFRSTPITGHIQSRLACLKGARERTRSAGGAWRRGRAITSAAV